MRRLVIEHAQIGRDRLLAGQQVQRDALDLGVQRVDRLVGADHTLGQAQVGIEQRRRRPAHHAADQTGHVDEPVGDGVKILVVRVAHGGLLPRDC